MVSVPVSCLAAASTISAGIDLSGMNVLLVLTVGTPPLRLKRAPPCRGLAKLLLSRCDVVFSTAAAADSGGGVSQGMRSPALVMSVPDSSRLGRALLTKRFGGGGVTMGCGGQGSGGGRHVLLASPAFCRLLRRTTIPVRSGSDTRLCTRM